MQEATLTPARFSPQSLAMSVYRTKIASQSRLVTITWCKNLLLHGLSVSVDDPRGHHHHHCKVELKPWYFWRKQGSKHFFTVEEQQEGNNTVVDIVWDLKAARFNGEVEPQSDYYLAIVAGEEVVLVVGDLKKEAFRRTGCRPALEDPVMVAKREHLFGKRRFSTRVKFDEREKERHEIAVEWRSTGGKGNGGVGVEEGLKGSEMEVKVDGQSAVHVKHLQWKFRGNVWIDVDKTKVEVCWDVHDWVFGSGPRHGLFLFKPMVMNPHQSSSPDLSSSRSLLFLSPEAEEAACSASMEKCGGGCDGRGFVHGLPEFRLILYAWKVE